VTVSQIHRVLGNAVAMKLLRLLKLSRRQSERFCPFCAKSMLMLNTQEPPLELEACRACGAVWFDSPTYESLPQLTLETTNSIPMQATEIIAMERLRELKEREEAERKQARKKRPLHRLMDPRADSEPGR
jgi:Zn-finger nucleic acid-binding protein